MMRHLGINLTTTVNKTSLLKTLRANREKHSLLVKEAKEGYLKSAQVALEERLQLIRDGKVQGLSFNLSVPMDNTSAYDTVIGMLENHVEDTVTLTASEYRMFVQDEWDWKSQFIMSNAAYSEGTRMLAAGEEGLFT